MSCDSLSYDNRETCINLQPSSCVPYTGAINASLKPEVDLVVTCRPNVNDILKAVQNLIDKMQAKLGDNTTLTTNCLTFTPATVTQKALNQLFINDLCTLQTAIAAIPTTVDPTMVMVTIDLLCLQTEGCDPAAQYSLQVILVKLITAYCDLLTRVQNIETILNI